MEGYFLEADGRVSIEYGPVSAVVTAQIQDLAQPEIIMQALNHEQQGLTAFLQQLQPDLPLLAQAWPKVLNHTQHLNPLGYKLWQITAQTHNPELTPLCGVAGLWADHLVDHLKQLLEPQAQGKTVKIIVNNGGDIGLYLQNTSLSLGLSSSLDANKPPHLVQLKPQSPIRGIATSGLGGRGLTQGIATAVTVFAANATLADALATSLANASYVASPRVTQVLAKTLYPNSDIGELMVTTQVLALEPAEIAKAWDQVQIAAKAHLADATLFMVYAHVGDQDFWLDNKHEYLS